MNVKIRLNYKLDSTDLTIHFIKGDRRHILKVPEELKGRLTKHGDRIFFPMYQYEFEMGRDLNIKINSGRALWESLIKAGFKRVGLLHS